jgi:hypothetical protein
MNEDFERESQKDFVYLLEAQRLEEEQIMKEIMEEESSRKPAQIVLIRPAKIQINEEEDKPHVLPF